MDAARIAEPAGPGAFDRRTALSAGLLATLAALGCDDCGPGGPGTSPTTTSSGSSAAPQAVVDQAVTAFVPVLVAIAECLIPSDDLGPGAKEAELAPFFRGVFADARLSTVQPLLKRGCAFMMKAAKVELKTAFVDLDVGRRDDLLQRLADNKLRPDGFSGPLFLRIVLALTLEGFLGDPRHGGNKGGVGWRVVGFSPDGRASGLALPVLK